MPKFRYIFLLFLVLAICIGSNGVLAFGAGNIPSFAYMEGKAFRHGDIEDTLGDLIKRGSGGGFALASILSKGAKFNGLDTKRVYFGSFKAVDVASLKKVQLQTIINLCIALGFLAHGYATNEFEVTIERLGVYLPTEHIDNPKGYADGEDARKYHPMLRGPVDPRETEVDPRTGMKNYIANENGTWDTSKALVRRTLEKCIHLGRQHRAHGRKQDEYEAYRLLGTALHTLEDFSAHSNFCELSLVAMGHRDVFVHVGDQVRIQAPNGKWVAPLVTGTFGGNDFQHSLLGEASDHISSASVSDLNKELDKARSTATRAGPGGTSVSPADTLRDLLFKLPGGDGNDMSREMENIERIRAGPAQGGKRPEEMSPQELHAVLWQVLTFRDGVVKKIEKTIEKIPGLGPLLEKLMESISVFVFTTLEPYLKPLMQTATNQLMNASEQVIDTHDQYEVFNDPRASDPTHSFLSKDHFNLILNEPAGHLAKIILTHTVNWVIKAWDDPKLNVQQVTEDILTCLFHPDFHDHNSKVQREMMQFMRDWLQKLGSRQHDVLYRLTKNAVRNHENIRLAGDAAGGGANPHQGSFAYNQAQQAQQAIAGYANQIPGVSQAQNVFGKFGSGPPGVSGREAPVYNTGYPGEAHGGPARRTTGEAASFYDHTPSQHGPYPPPQQSPYQPTTAPAFPYAPGGAPHAAQESSYMPATHSSYAPPITHSGYNPSYAPQPATQPLSFPSPDPAYSGYQGGPPVADPYGYNQPQYPTGPGWHNPAPNNQYGGPPPSGW